MEIQNKIILEPSLEDIGKRLDIFMSEKTMIARSQIQKLIKEDKAFVNNDIVNQSYKIKTNDVVVIDKFFEYKANILIPENIPLNILYKDDYIIVVDKPAQMVVYPSAGHNQGTLLNALSYQTSKLATIGLPLRPGIVHRLDKDTSGVMVVAIDDNAYYDLIEQFKNKTINRRYKAIVFGMLKDDFGEINLKIGRSLHNRKQMSTKTKRGKESNTKWLVVKRFNKATLIKAVLGTGRTHQIRVHFSAIGHPVLGDKIYGKKTIIEIEKKKISFPRQMLHAEILGFVHPITKEYMEFSSVLPDDMKTSIKELEAYTQ